MLTLLHFRRRLLELRKALVYTSDSPIYIDARFVPLMRSKKGTPQTLLRRRRLIQAFFALSDLYVVPTFGLTNEGDEVLVGVDGVLFPLRRIECPFLVYETAIVLIRDGYDIGSAFETAGLLERYP